MKSAHSQAQVRVDKALAEVPIDNRGERMKLHARLRQKYEELEPLKSSMNDVECACFEEIGEIIQRSPAKDWNSERVSKLGHDVGNIAHCRVPYRRSFYHDRINPIRGGNNWYDDRSRGRNSDWRNSWKKEFLCAGYAGLPAPMALTRNTN